MCQPALHSLPAARQLHVAARDGQRCWRWRHLSGRSHRCRPVRGQLRGGRQRVARIHHHTACACTHFAMQQLLRPLVDAATSCTLRQHCPSLQHLHPRGLHGRRLVAGAGQSGGVGLHTLVCQRGDSGMPLQECIPARQANCWSDTLPKVNGWAMYHWRTRKESGNEPACTTSPPTSKL